MSPRALAAVALAGLTTGVILALLSAQTAADVVWAAVIVLLIVPETLAVARTLR